MCAQTIDRAQQEEELCAVEAIFGDDCSALLDEHRVEVAIPDTGVTLRVHLPNDYPSNSPPVPELLGAHLTDDLQQWAVQQLQALFTPGEVVLYNWVEWLREQEVLCHPSSQAVSAAAEPDTAEPEGPSASQHAELKLFLDDEPASIVQLEEAVAANGTWHQHADAHDSAPAVVERIVHGEPFTEKKSTFQGHLAPVTSAVEVEAVMTALLQHNKIRHATHNIMAYRIHYADKDTFLQDYDDDGEDAAGGRLLHLLQVVDARNVVVVVSRWYGGVLLGPARFTHINNAARQLLDRCGYVQAKPGAASAQSGAAKKKKGRDG